MMKSKLLASLILILFFETPAYSANCIYKHQCPQVKLTRNISSFEEYCYNEINKIRNENGLQSLKGWFLLSDCARGHSQDMANGKCAFGHDGFQERVQTIQKVTRISHFGENVAYCYNYADPVKICIENWMKSKGHRKNILGHFEETGIGVSITQDGRFYITQIFATRM